MINQMKIEFTACSENERFARSVASAFCLALDPTVEELSDIRTAVSEAVTNSVIHAYKDTGGIIKMSGIIIDDTIEFIIEDEGIGIKDIEKAKQPLYTGSGDAERSGMGFTIMEEFMDVLIVESEPDQGTRIIMKKRISHEL